MLGNAIGSILTYKTIIIPEAEMAYMDYRNTVEVGLVADRAYMDSAEEAYTVVVVEAYKDSAEEAYKVVVEEPHKDYTPDVAYNHFDHIQE